MGRIARALVVGAAFAWATCVAGPQSDRDYAKPRSEDRVAPEQRVDVNRATLDELMKIPGMKRTWAQRILRYRPYRTKQDLFDEGVVPGAVYERIRDYLIAHRSSQ